MAVKPYILKAREMSKQDERKFFAVISYLILAADN
jgi:hypothetical protein